MSTVQEITRDWIDHHGLPYDTEFQFIEGVFPHYQIKTMYEVLDAYKRLLHSRKGGEWVFVDAVEEDHEGRTYTTLIFAHDPKGTE